MILYKPTDPSGANVWYYAMKTGNTFLLMAHNCKYNADRIIREYKTISVITAARKLNLKTGAERA